MRLSNDAIVGRPLVGGVADSYRFTSCFTFEDTERRSRRLLIGAGTRGTGFSVMIDEHIHRLRRTILLHK
jgi:hypothetical protein